MAKKRFEFTTDVWLYPGAQGAWHFVSVPKGETAVIRERFGALSRGWQSLPVAVTIGKTEWRTSIFFDKRSGEYLLPLKASIRRTERLKERDQVRVTMDIRV